jgi:hypothetical protein
MGRVTSHLPATTSSTLSPVERIERNARIAENRAAGEPWATIAAREGLSVRSARRAAERHLRTPGPPLSRPGRLVDINPEPLLAKIVATQEHAMTASLILMVGGESGSVRVGAARTAVGAASALLATLARLGLVNGLAGFQREIVFATRTINALADAYDLPEDAVMTAIDQVTALGWEEDDEEEIAA